MVLIFHEALIHDTNLCYNNLHIFTKNQSFKKNLVYMIHRITKVHDNDSFLDIFL